MTSYPKRMHTALDATDARGLAEFYRELPASTWPAAGVPMQLHIDYAVPSVDELQRHRQRAEDLGARLLLDRTSEDSEPLYVMADPAGHPFCLLVGVA